jgi:O-antigen/teichoic acid export membrane protein
VRALPGTLYYIFAGQLTVLLITLYGTTEKVAQVGALGRIATIATLLLSVFQLVASPRYARIPETETRKLLRTYLLLLAGLFAVCAAGVLFAWLFPEIVLFILGAQYSGLTHEVALAVAAGVTNVIFSAASNMAAVRGTVASPLISIPPGIALQALLVYVLPLDSVASMFWLNIAFGGVQFAATFAVFLRRLVRDARVPCPA